MADETPTIESASVAPESVPAVVEPVVSVEAVAPDALLEAAADATVTSEPDTAPVEAPTEPKVEEPAAEVKTEEPPVAEPAAPVYEAFKLPDGIVASQAQLEEFGGLAGKHSLTQEDAQSFIDLHASALKATAEAASQRQQDVFQETQQQWREDFYKSAGNRADTLADDAKLAIQKFTRTPAERKEVQDVLKYTGAGNHKAIIGILAAAGRVMRERAAPPRGLQPKGQPMRREDRRYAPKS